MFTGLVERVGIVASTTQADRHAPRRITIDTGLPAGEVALGDSVAIDGCCLTAVASHGHALTFEATTETLRRTTMGQLQSGSRVNLERSLRPSDRLGGHLVMGHIDGLGTVASRVVEDSAVYVGVEAPRDVAHLIAARGSIAVAGVSLTVTRVDGVHFYVALIPHTRAHTNLDDYQVGGRVNLEADVLARYVERLVEVRASAREVGDTK